MPTRMEKRQARLARLRRELLRWGAELALVIVLALLVRTFLFSLTLVRGPSMQDTLFTGQVVAVEKLSPRLIGPRREQVVICRYPDSAEYYVKRIVALEGDTVEISGGVTYLNGQALSEPYVTHPAQEDFGPVTVAPGCVFVMGDNRANSRDSRDMGALDEDMVTGHVFAVCYPAQSAHWLSTAD